MHVRRVYLLLEIEIQGSRSQMLSGELRLRDRKGPGIVVGVYMRVNSGRLGNRSKEMPRSRILNACGSAPLSDALNNSRFT